MDLELRNKIVLITGGAGTIGAAAAKVFVHEGSQVIIADSNAAQGNEVAAKLNSTHPERCHFFLFRPA